MSCEDSPTASPTNRKAEFLSKIYGQKRAINFLHEAPWVGCHAEVSVCLCLSNKASLCCSTGDVTSQVLPPLLPHPSSLPSSLPGSSSTYVTLYLRKQMSRGIWLSPLGVFRYLGVYELCVCALAPSVCSFSILPSGGGGCMTQVSPENSHNWRPTL